MALEVAGAVARVESPRLIAGLLGSKSKHCRMKDRAPNFKGLVLFHAISSMSKETLRLPAHSRISASPFGEEAGRLEPTGWRANRS